MSLSGSRTEPQVQAGSLFSGEVMAGLSNPIGIRAGHSIGASDLAWLPGGRQWNHAQREVVAEARRLAQALHAARAEQRAALQRLSPLRGVRHVLSQRRYRSLQLPQLPETPRQSADTG